MAWFVNRDGDARLPWASWHQGSGICGIAFEDFRVSLARLGCKTPCSMLSPRSLTSAVLFTAVSAGMLWGTMPYVPLLVSELAC